METTKRTDLLIAACEAILADDRVGAIMELAISAADKDDVDKAIDLAKEAGCINPKSSDPTVVLGMLLLHEKSQRLPAMNCFKNAILQDPNNALPLWYLACDELRAGRTVEALALLNATTECEPFDSYAVLTFIWLLNQLGKVEEAISITENKLLQNQVQIICRTLALLFESQETVLENDVLCRLFFENDSCALDMEYVAHADGHVQELLKAMTSKSNNALVTEEGSCYNSRCVHLINPALDVYKQRYGLRVAQHYTKSFLNEFLAAEIKRIFDKDKMRIQRHKKEEGRTIPADMVLVPSGSYIVGHSTYAPHHPERTSYVPAFLIDKYSVTNQQWREFQPSHAFPNGYENHPVTNVDFIQATMFARWKGKRLPTEIEWEAAARGPDGFRFPWGQLPDASRANCADNKAKRTTPVTQYPRGASPCGAIDMLGNVCEWVDEWGPPTDGRVVNRIAKGGHHCLNMANLASWLRNYCSPLTKGSGIGFRCAMDF